MADQIKPIGKDATGYEVLTLAVKDLLNQFPGLYQGETVKFEELQENKGIAFSANEGSLVYNEKRDILDMIHQTCIFPFFIIYRTSSTKERQKINIQEFLDTFGKWLCREPVVINGVQEKLNMWPQLSGGREIKQIVRDNSYGLEPQQNGIQDWVLPMSIQYINVYEL